MRLSRLAFIFAAVYFALIGGGVYYYQLFPIRVLHHALVTILLVVWLLRRIRSGLPATPLNPLLAALIGVWAVTAVFSLDPRSAFENLWFPLTHLVIFLIIADLIGRGRESLVWETFFLVVALIGILGLAQFIAWYTGIDLVPETGVGWLNVGMIIPPEMPMLYIPLGVSTWLAGFVAPALIVALGWAFSSARRSYRITFLGIAGVLLIVLIGTFSRGGFVSAAAGVCALIGLRVLRSVLRDRSMRRTQLVWLLPAAVLIAGVIGLVVLIGRSEARSTGDDLRFGLWRGAASMFTRDPLTGVGPGLFARAYREVRSSGSVDDRLSTAHNAYMNNAAETGIPGVLVMIGFGIVIFTRWWSLWQRADSTIRRARLEAAAAGLFALAVQSVFDTFVLTPLVLLSLVLTAYCVIEPGSLLKTIPSPARFPLRRAGAVGLTLLLIGYGVAFIQFDRAHAAFNRSLRDGDIEAAREAVSIDPYMNLYRLQVAYMIGQGEDRAAAQAAYEDAVALEPTWDTGWINLAGLREQAGDIDGALDALTRAIEIRNNNVGALNWARIAEAHAAAPEEEINARYDVAAFLHYLPLSDFWIETELRRQALTRFMHRETLLLNWRYRVAVLRDPDYAAALVPETPVTAEDWWVTGEHVLTVLNDPQRAADAFGEAIHLDRANGDYYVARARAEAAFDVAAARRDLDIADMLYTFYEYPNAARVALAETPEEAQRLRAAAVPPRVIDQNFEGVLYQGRVASFDVFPQLRNPGFGSPILQPWYDLAADYESRGRTDAAINVYRAILDHAPSDQHVAESLARLLPDS